MTTAIEPQAAPAAPHKCPPKIRRPDVPAVLARGLSNLERLIAIESDRLELLRATALAAHAIQTSPERIDDPLVRAALSAGYEMIDAHYAPEFTNAEGSAEYAIEKLGNEAGVELGLVIGRMLDIGSPPRVGPTPASRVAEEIRWYRKQRGICPECAEVHATGRLKYAEEGGSLEIRSQDAL